MDYSEERNKAYSRNLRYFGLNGDEVLTIGKDNVGEFIWKVSKNTKTASLILIRDEDISFQDFNKIILLNRSNKNIIFSNKFDITKLLLEIFPDMKNNFIKNYINIESLSWRARIKPNKLIVYIFVNQDIFNILHKTVKVLKHIIYNPRLKYSNCIYCGNSLYDFYYNTAPLDGVGLISYLFNLPICPNHFNFDLFKVSLEYRENKFNIDKLVNNKEEYLLVDNRTCELCGSSFLGSQPFCLSCIKSYNKYLLSVALNITNPNNPKRLIRNTRCVDCGRLISREGLCRNCEINYDWNRIDNELENGNLLWEDFLNNPDIREEFLLE
jgi:hypothetical protein